MNLSSFFFFSLFAFLDDFFAYSCQKKIVDAENKPTNVNNNNNNNNKYKTVPVISILKINFANYSFLC